MRRTNTGNLCKCRLCYIKIAIANVKHFSNKFITTIKYLTQLSLYIIQRLEKR